MPETPHKIYFIAIGGTGMAPLACLLKEKGHHVDGVDGPLYPPMSTLLADAGIEPRVGYEPGNLLGQDAAKPDLVIVGNAVPKHNPEVLAAEQLGLPRLSMPQALARFFLSERRPLVIAGTHGKTTTTTIASWVYTSCNTDPGYLIGGLPLDMDQSFRVGTGPRFIIEGDEYNASYFDRGPKFLHYQPQTLILTSAEYDHADLYPDPESLFDAFRRLVALVPKDGLVVAYGDAPKVREIAAEAEAKVLFYGLGEENDIRPLDLETDADGSRFRLEDGRRKVKVSLQVPGEHNLLNALAVWAVARHDGLAAKDVGAALASFRGVKRRLEELGNADGVTIVDDFAHHPTAVGKSLGGLRQRYPDGRVMALYEPRSLTAGRSFLFDEYRQAFQEADAVLFAPVFHAERLTDDERIDLEELSRQLNKDGVESIACDSIDEMLGKALAWARPGDVLATMSSGSFEGLPHRLLGSLREEAA